MSDHRSVHVHPTEEALAHAVADVVGAAVASRGPLRLILAGGRTPKRCYEILARMGLAWGRVTVLFSDERCVGPHDPDSNYGLAFDTLLRHVAPATVHRMPGELGADEAAARYDRVVAEGPLDLVLLGLGPDGHTASLFPGHRALSAGGLVTAVHDSPKPPAERVSLTLGALRGARRVIIMAAGQEKRDAVARALAGDVPAGYITQAEWFVTADALE